MDGKRFHSGPLDYSQFVKHPRFGRAPRYTTTQIPQPWGWNTVSYHCHDAIEGTSVRADLTRQTQATMPVEYYFDEMRSCLDCKRRFLFFALEQQYWYETLGFSLDANCVRCTDCRRQQHQIAQWRRRYEELCHVTSTTLDESLEWAEICLQLIEAHAFPVGKTTLVRRCLNVVRKSEDPTPIAQCDALRVRVLAAEGGRQS